MGFGLMTLSPPADHMAMTTRKWALPRGAPGNRPKRHFREIGKDIQTEPFTVIGVGDMSGDVFGNGMLLSEQIRLQGAFNHLHIFVDPDPGPGDLLCRAQTPV